jgi:hypothetical protein
MVRPPALVSEAKLVLQLASKALVLDGRLFAPCVYTKEVTHAYPNFGALEGRLDRKGRNA